MAQTDHHTTLHATYRIARHVCCCSLFTSL